jgi:hypothetical protein
MKERPYPGMAAVLLVLAALLAGATNAQAEVSVNINIPLPGVVIAEPPALVVIPGTYAYFAPDVDVDIIFYQGYWYRPYMGRWHVSANYNGPWKFVPAQRVPRTLVSLPPNYRHTPPGHQRMPYGQVKRNWRTWEQDRHWDKREARQERAARQEWREERSHSGNEKGRGKGQGRGKGKGKHWDD